MSLPPLLFAQNLGYSADNRRSQLKTIVSRLCWNGKVMFGPRIGWVSAGKEPVMVRRDQDRVQTPEQVAKANRQRVAAADSVLAMEEVGKAGVAVRKNMARLRELRLAKEAELAASGVP